MKSIALKLVGLVFVGLAILGAALPVLPTTPFLLVAAGCFAKSSPYLYEKLLSNRVFGPLINDWQEHKSIARKSKYIALGSIVLALMWSWFLLDDIKIKLLVLVLILFPAVFIWRLPLTEHKKSG
ncbi:YbaN family protein [Thalassotalea atypica]|uniref:YbaN family protein n=1 Tax=Thalassotalea atypica TaxID=2054316 RepID=UPI002573F135|nr:YbaN family protein [Thalassotalea atypica]